MKRLALVLSPLALAACVAVPVAPATEVPPPPVAYAAPAPPPRVEAWYGGEHFVPDAYGGGWCYESRPHRHDYLPDRPDAYVLDGGYYLYRGPLVVTYYEGHPAPSGGWCYARGPHTHEFLPPSGGDWRWQRDRGYVYQGGWRPHRPPPATYWPRVAPRRGTLPAASPYPSQPVPAPAYPVRALPTPAPRSDDRYRDHDRREAAPGHGNLPPGHGGTPPGQVTAPDRRDPRSASAPGHFPPGQGGVPPGQRKKGTAAPAPTPAPAAATAGPARRTAPAPAKATATRERRDGSQEDSSDEATRDRSDAPRRPAPREIPTR